MPAWPPSQNRWTKHSYDTAAWDQVQTECTASTSGPKRTDTETSVWAFPVCGASKSSFPAMTCPPISFYQSTPSQWCPPQSVSTWRCEPAAALSLEGTSSSIRGTNKMAETGILWTSEGLCVHIFSNVFECLFSIGLIKSCCGVCKLCTFESTLKSVWEHKKKFDDISDAVV